FFLKLCAVLSDWFEQFGLLTYSDQGCMRFAELSKMTQQAVHLFVPVTGFEHVVADEIVEAMDVLHRDCLVKDLHRFRLHSRELDEPSLKFLKCFRRPKAIAAKQLEDSVSRLDVAKILLDGTLILRKAVDFLNA